MIVYGIHVTDGQQENALALLGNVMDDNGAFKFRQLVNCLSLSGVNENAAYRAADRMLQKKRAAGSIKFTNGKWKHT